MTWILQKVTRAPHADSTLAVLLQSVTMEFVEFDDNGIATGKTRSYNEQNVSDVSDAGIARLARDQLRQLEVIAKSSTGDADINVLRALVTPPAPPPPTANDLALQAFNVKRARLQEIRGLVADGILDDTDQEYVDLLAEVRQDFVALRK